MPVLAGLAFLCVLGLQYCGTAVLLHPLAGGYSTPIAALVVAGTWGLGYLAGQRIEVGRRRKEEKRQVFALNVTEHIAEEVMRRAAGVETLQEYRSEYRFRFYRASVREYINRRTGNAVRITRSLYDNREARTQEPVWQIMVTLPNGLDNKAERLFHDLAATEGA